MKILSKIIDNEKGAMGLDPAMGDRRSRADITRAVPGARLHIIH
jgi:hypothetical protein